MDAYEDDEAWLEHIGIKRRSGRYPWGSGKDPFQRSGEFKKYYQELKDQGLKDTEIAQMIENYVNSGSGHYVSFKTPELRAAIAVSTEQINEANRAMAQNLSDKGLSNGAIAEKMGLPRSAESTVRGWLKAGTEIKEGSIRATAEQLKNRVDEVDFLDVGKGTWLYMGINETKLRTALTVLKDEGYEVHTGIKVPQLGTDKMTEYKILAKPGTTWNESRLAVLNSQYSTMASSSKDGGLTYSKPAKLPLSASSKQIQVRYKEDGGDKMDGVIEIRRGLPELSLGANRYAQVRVAVDGTHFMKGMAMYADDLPPGVNMRFNSAKSKIDAPNKTDAMKPLKVDKATGEIDVRAPFGSSTYPWMYVDKSGKEKQSVLNIVGSERDGGNLEGRWDQWANTLSSQMLSKQPVALAAKQLGQARVERQKEFDRIMALTNPVVKKKLLDEFAESSDAAAVHLKAASLPRQANAVILPINAMRPGEIYAPGFNHGEKVALVRHPHGGPFEIPELTVNLRNLTAKRILANAKDAVGIHSSVAEQLSGADFDGDSVLVIPNNTRSVKSRPPLDQLKGFDPKKAYKIPDDDTTIKRMTKKNTQTEMGRISNLITDMTILGANHSEIAKAVKHSMVVIDAEKHGLNYKQSELDNDIKLLRETYQKPYSAKGGTGGAATIISRASSTERVPQLKLRKAKDGGPVDPKTGELVYEATGNSYVRPKINKKTGEVEGESVVENLSKGTRMGYAKDARELLSGGVKNGGTPMEEVYAAHANSLKALANEARRVAHPVNLKMPSPSPTAKKVYAKEVESLMAKLKVAQRNAPLERQAQALGNQWARAKIDANPQFDRDDIKKVKYQMLEDARLATGAAKLRIGSDDSPITSREWAAIQAGAISSTTLREILSNSDMKRIRELATPRTSTSLTPGQLARARQLEASGQPLSEIAAALGIPRSTLSDNLAK